MAEKAKADGVRVKDKIAVVLTDLEMPEMDGFTLTRLIKQDARFKGIPVVIHSSLTGATNENHVKGVGAEDVYKRQVSLFMPRLQQFCCYKNWLAGGLIHRGLSATKSVSCFPTRSWQSALTVPSCRARWSIW